MRLASTRACLLVVCASIIACSVAAGDEPNAGCGMEDPDPTLVTVPANSAGAGTSTTPDGGMGGASFGGSDGEEPIGGQSTGGCRDAALGCPD
jgi:hypothetical protein